MRRIALPGLLVSLLTILATGAVTGQAPTKPGLTPADYPKWESIGFGTVVSPDGRWVAWQLNRVNEHSELVIGTLDRDTAAVRARGSKPRITTEYGTGAVFGADSRWAAFLIGVSPEDREQAETAKRPIRNRLGVVELGTGTVTTVDRVASFQFSANGRYLALRGYPVEGKTSQAADLLIRDLAAGTMTSFGNVTGFAWADTGAVVAMTVEPEGSTANGVQLYDPGTGIHRVLESGPAHYRALAWRKKSDDLAALRTVISTGYRDTTHAVLAWTRVRSAAPTLKILEPTDAAIPADRRIAEQRGLEWADDGTGIAIGLRPRETSPDSARPASRPDSGRRGGPVAAEKRSDVQVWHAKDARIIPMQRSQEQQDLRRTLLAVWHPGTGTVVRIGTDLMGQAQLLRGWRFATEQSGARYTTDNMFGRDKADIAVVDPITGTRRPAVERVRFFLGGSATGKYLLFFRGGQYWTVDAATGAQTNITAKIPTVFADTGYDTPGEELPPYGFGAVAWSTDDRFVLLHDQYDVWRVSPDGSGGQRLTDGGAEKVIHRVVVLDRQAPGIDPTKPVFIALTGDRTKQTGFARIRPGRPAERLLLEDARLSRLIRADSSDTFVFQRERFDDSPDLFVATAELRDGRQVTATNPFQSGFAWGHGELVEYTTVAGKQLQGALFYPARFDPSRKYPMIVNPYEIQSTQLHAYSVPTERNYYDIQAWTQQGYFVLLPDIVFRKREPGPSTVEALEAAVAAVVAKGAVDGKKVGLVGHSWGGYEAAYVPTRSNIFAASVAGAPLTDFISMMGAIHWTPGLPETQHWETGQARMEVPFWEDFDAHIRSSPVARINQLKTPMLMMFGDADGTVDWHQGIEFYNFARRAGNPDFVLLVYPGEDHGLRKKENQIDYHRRIMEWFGHWLKDDPAPAWMKEGVPWLDRKRALDDAAPKRPSVAPTSP